MSWRMAQSLEVLRGEINALAPNRSVASDGGIGDEEHATRDSDHNPWRPGRTVGARDFTHDPAGGLDCNVLAKKLAALLGRHPALGPGAYIIWDWKIISTDRLSEGWRPYGGENGHTKHLHLSVGTSNYDSTVPWGIGIQEDEVTPEDLNKFTASVKKIVDAAVRPLATRQLVNARNKASRQREQRTLVLLRALTAEQAQGEKVETDRHRRLMKLLLGIDAELESLTSEVAEDDDV